METKRKKVLATLVDQSHLEYAKQLFAGAHINGGWDGDYLIMLYGEADEQLLSWFTDRGIYIFHCQSLWGDHGPWPGILLSKLYLFHDYFKQWENVVFIDVDCLVRSSIEVLGDMSGLAGVPFYYPLPPLNVEGKNVKPRDLFFGGVIAYSTDIILSDTFLSLVEHQKKLYESFPQGHPIQGNDELIFHGHFKDSWKPLPPAYNMMPFIARHYYSIKPADIKGVIIHYAAGDKNLKPWDEQAPHYAEWKKVFDLAESCDFAKPQVPRKKWSNVELRLHAFVFRTRYYIAIVKKKLDQALGQVGKKIRKLF